MSQKTTQRDPCKYRYHTNNKNGFQHPKARKLIDYMPQQLSIKSIGHSISRKKRSKYLTNEDANNKNVSITVPPRINISDSNNVIFELGTVEVAGSREAVSRVCVRMTNTPVEVTNTDADYSHYDYCLVIQIENPEQPYSVNKAKLITVYLNNKNDWHDTVNKSNYDSPDSIKL